MKMPFLIPWLQNRLQTTSSKNFTMFKNHVLDEVPLFLWHKAQIKNKKWRFNFLLKTTLICSVHWGNAVVLGRMYRSMLSSFWGIEGQYLPTCEARRKVLLPNSEEWWQHWPIYLTQNYRIHIVIKWKLFPNWGQNFRIGFFLTPSVLK